jgi:hypothetical protein
MCHCPVSHPERRYVCYADLITDEKHGAESILAHGEIEFRQVVETPDTSSLSL